MKIKVTKMGTLYTADPIDIPGTPYCGKGLTLDAALASFLRLYQRELGITEIILDKNVEQTELHSRQRTKEE